VPKPNPQGRRDGGGIRIDSVSSVVDHYIEQVLFPFLKQRRISNRGRELVTRDIGDRLQALLSHLGRSRALDDVADARRRRGDVLRTSGRLAPNQGARGDRCPQQPARRPRRKSAILQAACARAAHQELRDAPVRPRPSTISSTSISTRSTARPSATAFFPSSPSSILSLGGLSRTSGR
jgi:hypothetical protein